MNRRDAIVGIGLLLAGCSGGGAPVMINRCGGGGLRAMLCAGGSIALPAGTWVVNDPPLTMPPGTVIRGAGIGQTIIRYTGRSHLIIDADNVAISDLTLDGSLCPGPAPRGTFDNALVFLRGKNTSLLRVRIQSAPSFGLFVFGGSPTVQSCQLDDCGRLNFQDTLGADHSNGPVLYDSNVFTNCHGNAIDNCGPLTGTWSNNSVLSVAQSGPVVFYAGDIIADSGATVVIQNNTLTVGAIQVYAASAPACNSGEPQGCQVLDNVIQTGTLCDTPLCPGLYIVPGNTHHGNVIGGVLVD